MKKNIVVTIVAVFLLIAEISAQAIGHTQITFTDPNRSNRAIQTEIYYPAATAQDNVPVSGGPYPVLVFGHGFVMVWSAYQNIWTNLVPQGYIIAFPRTEGTVSPNHDEFGKDLAFLVTEMQSQSSNNSSSLFYGKINSRSAIMGHSMGGGSSFLAAENNSSVTTMVTLAAANTNPSSITAAQNITIPSLVLAGQNDCVAPPAQHQQIMYDSLASSCKAYVSITGGGHCYFAETNFNCSFGEGTCTPNPTITRPEQQDAAQDMISLWLGYYLKDSCSYWSAFNDSVNVSGRLTGTISCASGLPQISQNGNILQSTAASTYQWLLSGNPVAGANAQTYTPVQNGVYSVLVTYTNGCSFESNTINFTMTGTDPEIFTGDLNLVPNPATESVVLNGNFFTTGNLQIEIFSAEGKLVERMSENFSQGKNTITEIALRDYAPGVYIIRCSSNRQSKNLRLVVVK